MNFIPCKADPDLWMRDCNDPWEYVCVYIDNIACVSRNPKAFFDSLFSDHHYTLKGVGCDFTRNSKDNTLAVGAKTYVKRIILNYKTSFGMEPKLYLFPLKNGDHPEVNASQLLDFGSIKLYQSLISALQWAITLGRFDTQCAVMTMGRFCAAPRKGQLNRLRCTTGYRCCYPDAAICFCTGNPNHEAWGDVPQHDWMYLVYGTLTDDDSLTDMPPAHDKNPF
jgi:hypothetical protein